MATKALSMLHVVESICGYIGLPLELAFVNKVMASLILPLHWKTVKWRERRVARLLMTMQMKRSEKSTYPYQDWIQTLSFRGRGVDDLCKVPHLIEFASKLPNLKCLVLEFESPYFRPIEYLCRSVYPTLPSLETLVLRGDHNRLLIALARAAPNLKEITYSDCRTLWELDQGYLEQRFRYIDKKLRECSYNCCYYIYDLKYYEPRHDTNEMK